MSYDKHLQEGLKYIEHKDYTACLDIAEKLQDMTPTCPDGFHLAALALQYEMKWEDSLSYLNRAIELSPEDGNLFNLRGFAKMSLENYDGAEKDFKMAIAVEDHDAAHRNLGLLLILTDHVADGLGYILDRIKAQPEDIHNWIIMGDIMAHEGLTDKAKSYYKQAQKLDPENEYLMSVLSTAA